MPIIKYCTYTFVIYEVYCSTNRRKIIETEGKNFKEKTNEPRHNIMVFPQVITYDRTNHRTTIISDRLGPYSNQILLSKFTTYQKIPTGMMMLNKTPMKTEEINSVTALLYYH